MGKISRQRAPRSHEIQKTQSLICNKSLGQHLLKNPLIVDAIVKKCGLQPHDIVFEVGPGTGNLTQKLLKFAKKVIVCEIDPRMAAELQKRFQATEFYHKLEIIVGDVLKIDWPFFNVLVANLPYQISSPFVFKMLLHRPLYRASIIMFQREFALRLVAKPGDSMYSRLSVNSQLLSKIDHIMKVGKNNFNPIPKVDSSVVRFQPKNPLPPVHFSEWDGLTRLCFNRKNKTLGAIFAKKKVIQLLENNYMLNQSLNNQEPVPKENFKEFVIEILKNIGMEESRSRCMSNDQFFELLNEFNKNGIHFT